MRKRRKGPAGSDPREADEIVQNTRRPDGSEYSPRSLSGQRRRSHARYPHRPGGLSPHLLEDHLRLIGWSLPRPSRQGAEIIRLSEYCRRRRHV